jgi:hypothetical protein
MKRIIAVGVIAGILIGIVGIVVAQDTTQKNSRELNAVITPTVAITPSGTPKLIPSPTLKPTRTPTPKPTLTPTVTPIPTFIPYTSEILEGWFSRYSDEYHCDKELLRKIAACESGFNATSFNAKHNYAGIYQFAESTWRVTRRQMGVDENPDLRFNPEEAIKTAAFKISRGGVGAWKNCAQ